MEAAFPYRDAFHELQLPPLWACIRCGLFASRDTVLTRMRLTDFRLFFRARKRKIRAGEHEKR
ncbi:DNA-directed RNA polymerase subunit beta [Erythrobacter sp. SD-21]|nr:DNA-directed RNA polymerase subunit beta [Erythrobacter sp. SD-21]